VLDENTSLPHALTVVQQAKGMIHELETLLPASPKVNFRERLVAYLENPQDSREGNYGCGPATAESRCIVDFYEKVFGVKDLVDQPMKSNWGCGSGLQLTVESLVQNTW